MPENTGFKREPRHTSLRAGPLSADASESPAPEDPEAALRKMADIGVVSHSGDSALDTATHMNSELCDPAVRFAANWYYTGVNSSVSPRLDHPRKNGGCVPDFGFYSYKEII